ncbi:Hsp20/alpha crystallin family protein [Nostoc sp. FACHB-110]|uniref:Hsp20/alpha crystallin family protein n=1 Tax=Nostoc sp. FACHB-110 TaxID=2692834 RepID=UPI00168353E6|nr:Hsp20/alpha crystallin family protein [Nostoc sp. FACHB-110]MBD2435792.1 Hsp20/alpha crystallin family protein [Nostoc sp. FACHB-110]
MMISYFQPIREIENLRRNIDLVFDGLSVQTNQSTETADTWSPAIELIDAGDSLVLKVQLPGVTAQNIDVQVTRDTVSIVGDRQRLNENTKYLHSEFRYGQFQRVVNLPVAVQNDKVKAEFKDGILTLTLPKVEEVRNRVVKINLGEVTDNSVNRVDANV